MRDRWRDNSDDFEESWANNDDSSDDSWSEDAEETDGETEERECPKCGCDIYANLDQCPLCGEWFTRTHTVWDGRPAWFVWLGFAGIVAVILSILMVI